jgi:pilus assembly protein CpaB
MNRTRLLMIGALALALGLLTSLYVYRTLQAKTVGNAEPGIDVIVAADDIQVGQKVEEHDIKIVKIPVSALPPNTPRRKSDVVGHGVIVPITKGEFILPTKLAAENAGAGLPALIPPGMRAVGVRVNDVTSVAGFVTAGTRVDVLLTGTPSGSSDQQTTTVLQNIAVLTAGKTLERSATGEAQTVPVITLLVTPEDAQRLTLAGTQGHIQLALRNPIDTRAEDVPASSARGLYRGSAPAPLVAHAPPRRTISVSKVEPAPAPTGVSVEVYQGDKPPETVKCTNEAGCGEAK